MEHLYYIAMVLVYAIKGAWRHLVLGAERILCGLMKLKNLIFAKGMYRQYENMLSQENFEFQPI